MLLISCLTSYISALYKNHFQQQISQQEQSSTNRQRKIEEDDVEEGNKFTGNLAKARAQGKKEADLDGDGDLEKVRESVNSMWKSYKG